MNLPVPPFLLARAVAIRAVAGGSADDPAALTPVDHALAELDEDDFSGLVMLALPPLNAQSGPVVSNSKSM
jgi:hypothetical protein